MDRSSSQQMTPDTLATYAGWITAACNNECWLSKSNEEGSSIQQQQSQQQSAAAAAAEPAEQSQQILTSCGGNMHTTCMHTCDARVNEHHVHNQVDMNKRYIHIYIQISD